MQTFLIALPAEHAAKFFQPFFLPGLAGTLFLWYHALQKQKWPQAAGEPPWPCSQQQEGHIMKFFSLENPIWKFIGNLADFFLLSCLWYLCCLPVVTAGAATTALYYVTLKIARGQEGQLIPAFFHSFKQNLKQATALWVGYLAVGILLVLDLVICLQTSSVFAGAMFFTSVVLLACWALFITMLFPLVARCDNTIGALFKMGIAMALRNVMPVLAALMVTVAFFAVGVFVFWPVLLVAPGLASYCNAFLFNRIFDKYGMTLE